MVPSVRHEVRTLTTDYLGSNPWGSQQSASTHSLDGLFFKLDLESKLIEYFLPWE